MWEIYTELKDVIEAVGSLDVPAPAPGPAPFQVTFSRKSKTFKNSDNGATYERGRVMGHVGTIFQKDTRTRDMNAQGHNQDRHEQVALMLAVAKHPQTTLRQARTRAPHPGPARQRARCLAGRR